MLRFPSCFGDFDPCLGIVVKEPLFLFQNEVWMKLNKTLTSLCKSKGMTLAELSRRTGIPKQTLHNWTIGRRSINPDQLKKVSQVLEVSVHYLLYGENDPFEAPSEVILREIFSGDVRVTLHRIERKGRK